MTLFTEFGRYLLMIKGMFSKPENMKMYWKELMHQCNEIGIGSLGIVVIISFFMGAVSALQTAYQLVSPVIPDEYRCTDRARYGDPGVCPYPGMYCTGRCGRQ